MFIAYFALLFYSYNLIRISNALCINSKYCKNRQLCEKSKNIEDSCIVTNFSHEIEDPIRKILKIKITSPIVAHCDVKNFQVLLIRHPEDKCGFEYDGDEIAESIWCNYNAGACSNLTRKDMSHHHYYWICSQDMIVRFANVSNGCYSFHLQPETNIASCEGFGKTFLVKYNESNISRDAYNYYNIVSKHNHNTIEAVFRLNYKWLETERLSIEYININTKQRVTLRHLDFCKKNATVETEVINNLKLSCNIDQRSDYPHMFTRIECLLQNASEGKYVIVLHPHGPLAKGSLRFEHKHIFPDNSSVRNFYGSVHFIPAIIPVLVFAILALYFYRSKIKHNRKFTRKKDRRTVVFIYARDCEAVMKLIKEFSNLLNKFGIQVLDIFDPKCIDQYCSNKFEYLQNALGNGALPIFFSTEVGKILYERSLNARDAENYAFKWEYQSPDCFDDQFVRNMKEIMRMPGLNYYTIRFSDLYKNDFGQLRPKNCFKMPKDLVAFLELFQFDEESIEDIFDNETTKQLEICINNAKTYFKQNPSYILEDLLN